MEKWKTQTVEIAVEGNIDRPKFRFRLLNTMRPRFRFRTIKLSETSAQLKSAIVSIIINNVWITSMATFSWENHLKTLLWRLSVALEILTYYEG